MVKCIAMYDMSDNFIMEFDSYKDLSIYFNRSTKSLQCSISRIKNNKNKSVIDHKNKRKVKLYIIE